MEQEKCIASDLQKTLNEEQEKANSVRKLLVVEENAVRALRAELCECKQDNERLLASLHDMQQEVVQLRYGGAESAHAPAWCSGTERVCRKRGGHGAPEAACVFF